MYSISYTINKLSKIIKKDEIQSLFFSIDNTDIIFICKYLDSIIYNINTKNIGLISIEIFKKNIVDFKNKTNNNKILSFHDDEYIIEDYDKKAINKILYWIETYNYIDKEGLFEKQWIINTHYDNYPKLWLSTMFVFNIIRQYKNCALDYLLHIKKLHITHLKLLNENNNKKETLYIINNALFFIGTHDIQIIYNIELFNDNYIDCDDHNIELKKKCLIEYLNIIINIIDNVMYEKGYFDKRDKIINKIFNNLYNNLYNNINTVIFTTLFILFILFIIIFYNIPNVKYYYKFY